MESFESHWEEEIEDIQLQCPICFAIWLRDMVLDKGKREKTPDLHSKC